MSVHIELAISAITKGCHRGPSLYFAIQAFILMRQAFIIDGLQGTQLHHMCCIDPFYRKSDGIDIALKHQNSDDEPSYNTRCCRDAGVSTAANSQLNKRTGQHYFDELATMITAREMMSSCTLALSSSW